MDVRIEPMPPEPPPPRLVIISMTENEAKLWLAQTQSERTRWRVVGDRNDSEGLRVKLRRDVRMMLGLV